MKRPRNYSSKAEHDMVKLIQEKDLFDQIMPAIREAVKHGGGADNILKRSEPLAAATLARAALNGDVKAATEILNRVSGRPVERSINVYGDISKMNERDVDSQIMQLLERTGASKLLGPVLDVKPPKRKQKRKPRNVIEANIIEPTEGPNTSAEARPASEPTE